MEETDIVMLSGQMSIANTDLEMDTKKKNYRTFKNYDPRKSTCIEIRVWSLLTVEQI